jgi:hypothetical protein
MVLVPAEERWAAGRIAIRRDGDMPGDDTLSIVLDTYRDRRTGYFFQINELEISPSARAPAEREWGTFSTDASMMTCGVIRDFDSATSFTRAAPSGSE